MFLDPDNRRKACPVSVKARLRRDKHVREDKDKAGLSGSRRGKEATALGAAGTLGSFGLAFAVVIWRMMEAAPVATVAWISVSVLAWILHRYMRHGWDAHG
jgi:hypothetical protein